MQKLQINYLRITYDLIFIDDEDYLKCKKAFENYKSFFNEYFELLMVLSEITNEFDYLIVKANMYHLLIEMAKQAKHNIEACKQYQNQDHEYAQYIMKKMIKWYQQLIHFL